MIFLGQDCQKQFLSASISTLNSIGRTNIIYHFKYLVDIDYQLGIFSMLWMLRYLGAQVQPVGAFHGLPRWLWRRRHRGILGYWPNTSRILVRYHRDYWLNSSEILPEYCCCQVFLICSSFLGGPAFPLMMKVEIIQELQNLKNMKRSLKTAKYEIYEEIFFFKDCKIWKIWNNLSKKTKSNKFEEKNL